MVTVTNPANWIPSICLVTLSVACNPPQNDGDNCDDETGPGQDLNGGAWEDQEDWTDPGEPGLEELVDVCGLNSAEAHHCLTTAVHAIHMHTGQVLMPRRLICPATVRETTTVRRTYSSRRPR